MGQDLPVEVVRSANRRKTVQARVVGGRLVLRIPARMSAADERHWVQEMSRRLTARRAVSGVDLAQRSTALARRYDLPVPESIRWVTNQRQRWGSCTVSSGEIRISVRLATYPGWVLDYVIVHELAHLVVADHGPRFQALVDRYRKAERARGYLIAKSSSTEDPDDGRDGELDDLDVMP